MDKEDTFRDQFKNDISILALIQQNATTALNRDNIDFNQRQRIIALIEEIIKENKNIPNM